MSQKQVSGSQSPPAFNPVALSIFANRVAGICEEMGAVLMRAAFSPNIKDRLDFSCAIFDSQGELCAQAAHIPVHLGSMAYAMRDVVARQHWQPGVLLVLNDPYLGGTHLPDVTVIAPVFLDEADADAEAGRDTPLAFVVTRAHHADMGADTPGSMPVSCSLHQEGLVIHPDWLSLGGQDEGYDSEQWQPALVKRLAGLPEQVSLSEALASHRFGDYAAQASACRVGVRRLVELCRAQPAGWFATGVRALNHYADVRARAVVASVPPGVYQFTDYLDDDGQGETDIPITVSLTVRGEQMVADFTGSAAQVRGNINCPMSVTAAAVYYCLRCLMPDDVPSCAGMFRPVTIRVPDGSLLNARYPAAVAAGNVETSSRVVDAVLGALAQAIPDRIPAASQGTMNNVAMGYRGDGQHWDYYETMGGGAGASAVGPGLSGIQTHMTNTLNTPVESLESHYPLQVLQYRLRDGSGGAGRYAGGDGLVRELLFLAPATVTLLTERRNHTPWGLQGGAPGQAGENRLNNTVLPPKFSGSVKAGDRLTIATPGGGGYGAPVQGCKHTTSQ